MALGFPVDDDRPEDDFQPAVEWKMRAIAIPVAFVLAIAFHASRTGHMLQRTFLSMMVHEVGHAVAAWWSGFTAIPVPWKTMIGAQRSIGISVLVAALCCYLIVRGLAGRRWLIGLGAVGLVLQGIATLGLSTAHAHALITFAGDGGAMVLGTALMLSMFAGRDTQLYRGWLRWGFLVIGAAAFVDTFATWWTARTNPDVIPFGEIEGVGLSDPSKLSEVNGWTDAQIIHRYVVLGVICLIVLAAAYAWGVWSARREALAAEPAPA